MKTIDVLVEHSAGILSLQLGPRTTAKEIFYQVCSVLGLKDTCYFGLEYERKAGQVRWLRPGKRLGQVARSGKARLRFLVKYFPEQVGKVADQTAVALLYEEAVKEVSSGRVYCPAETSVLLASYVLQASSGDWVFVDHSRLDVARLLPPAVLGHRPLPHEAWGRALGDWHRDHEGLTPHEARREYLRVAQHLAMYGVVYFHAAWLGLRVRVGVHPRGVSVFTHNSLLVAQDSLSWVFIKRVHYSCDKLVVRSVLDYPDFVFRMRKVRTAREAFRVAVGYHQLHVRHRLLPSLGLPRPGDVGEAFKETCELEAVPPARKELANNEPTHTQLKWRPSYKLLPTLHEESD